MTTADVQYPMSTEEELPDGLKELKQLVLRMGQRVDLPLELMTELEKTVGRLVTQLAALLRDSNASVTQETLIHNLIEMTELLNALEIGVGERTGNELAMQADKPIS